MIRKKGDNRAGSSITVSQNESYARGGRRRTTGAARDRRDAAEGRGRPDEGQVRARAARFERTTGVRFANRWGGGAGEIRSVLDHVSEAKPNG